MMARNIHPMVVTFSNKELQLQLLSLALKDYKKQGKSIEQFEVDYDCVVQYNSYGQIKNISCNNDSTKTMMKLKYAK